MKKIYFIVPTFRDSITGGSLYDYQVIRYLKKKHIRVSLIEVDHNISSLRINKVIKSLPIKSKILIDGYLSSKLYKSSFSQEIILLIHHPCTLENTDYILSDISLFFREKKSFSRAKKIITVSKTIMKIIRSISNVHQEISVAYPGIEKSYCNLVSTLNNNKMISIGNIIPRKGYHNLIEALRNIDGDWELNIVGNEKMNIKYYTMIKSKIERYKLSSKIKFTGQTEDSKIKELISRSSIFVLPTRYEGFGMSIMECAAAGLEVITSDIPVLREVLKGLSVTFVNKDSISELESTIKNKLINKNIKLNRKVIEKYNWVNTAKEIKRAIYG
jgi:glycosyltransferase involved in cell wall biosynthesis